MIPAGLGGLWHYSVTMTLNGAATSGDGFTTWANVGGQRMGGSTGRRGTGGAADWPGNVSVIRPLAAGAVIYAEVLASTSDGQGRVLHWSLVRLGRGFGLPGAVSATMLAAAAELRPDASLPEEGES